MKRSFRRSVTENALMSQAVLSSMAMILNRIEERGILGAKHLLDKILRCICLSGHCQEKKNLLKGFCRPCVLEEWGGLSNLDAEKKLIQVTCSLSVFVRVCMKQCSCS